MKPINKYKEYSKEIRQLLYWNFINVEEVEQRHIDAYLNRIKGVNTWNYL